MGRNTNWSREDLADLDKRRGENNLGEQVFNKKDFGDAPLSNKLPESKLPKQNKYKNVKVEVDGIMFDSKREAKRYGELKMMEKAGEIFHLELQPSHDLICDTLIVNGKEVKLPYKLIKEYIADFCYMNNDAEWIYEDCKGVKTKEYKLKKRLMKIVYEIEIQEV